MKAKTINLLIAGDDNRRFFPALILGLLVSVAGCSGSSSSGTTGGNGTIVVPLVGFWNGSWSRNTTLTDLINDTDDSTTQLDPEDGVARLQITSASDSSQTISGELLISGFSCFDTGRVSGSWSGSNIGMTAVSESTQVSTRGISTTVTVVSGGTGYTSVPTVTFSAPEVSTGTTATGTAAIGGTAGVASIAVDNDGDNYHYATITVTITAPDLSGGTQATAIAAVEANKVVGIVVTEKGSGYTTAPNVIITDPKNASGDGGDGRGATATATLTDTAALGLVTNIIVDEAGSGYETAPTISITGGGGSGALATAALGSTVTIKGTGIRLSLAGHQTAGGQIKLAYSVASGSTCDAKRGSITLSKSD
jgi:hypothetical protein